MTTKPNQNLFRGHEIYMDGEQCRYLDDDTLTVYNWKDRGCGFCGKSDTPEGHDGCLGTLLGVMNACCGHGEDSTAYVQFNDGSEVIGGKTALVLISAIKRVREAQELVASVITKVNTGKTNV